MYADRYLGDDIWIVFKDTEVRIFSKKNKTEHVVLTDDLKQKVECFVEHVLILLNQKNYGGCH